MVARADGPTTVLEQPGPAVWEAIRTELGLSVELGADTSGPPVRRQEGSSVVVPIPDPPARAGRQFSARWLAVAAGIGVLVGGGALWGVQSLGADREAVVQAQAALEPLPGYSGSGEATVSRASDGSRTLDVDLTGPAPEGYRQVWLIAPDLGQMYSIGLMDGDRGSFAVPADIDLAQFPIVDVSDEPFDGNPTHSSVSMVRGTIGGTSS